MQLLPMLVGGVSEMKRKTEQLERAQNCKYKNINSLGGREICIPRSRRDILVFLSIGAINKSEKQFRAKKPRTLRECKIARE